MERSKEELLNEIEDYKVKLQTASENIILLLDNQSKQQEQHQALLNENLKLVEENETMTEIIEELLHYKSIAKHLMSLMNKEEC